MEKQNSWRYCSRWSLFSDGGRQRIFLPGSVLAATYRTSSRKPVNPQPGRRCSAGKYHRTSSRKPVNPQRAGSEHLSGAGQAAVCRHHGNGRRIFQQSDDE